MTAAARQSAIEIMAGVEEPSNTRDKILRVAINLFYFHGFHAVGIDHIINEVGVTKTTFYNHFESKDELVLESVRLRDQWEREVWMRMIRERSDDPRGQLLAAFDVLHEWFNHKDFGGCLFINAAAQYPSPNDPVHQIAADHKLAFEQFFIETADAAGARDPEELGKQLNMIVEGAINYRHITGSDDAAKLCKSMVERLLNDELIVD